MFPRGNGVAGEHLLVSASSLSGAPSITAELQGAVSSREKSFGHEQLHTNAYCEL